ncbi:hypothetical protein GCM10008908_25230 [Clostridium subterminale]|uniref:Uncharacterized protein n=1 Tax=Clostridium subterminale TaxID=1550 RepID=A0ABP3W168_CLOSU
MFWDNVFKAVIPNKYENADLGQEDLNEALKWLICIGSSGWKSLIQRKILLRVKIY